MDYTKLTNTQRFLQEIKTFRKREILSECWEILWRRWDAQLMNEYFIDNHLYKIDGLISRITCEYLSNAKKEVIDEFDKISSKPNVNEKLHIEVTTEIKRVMELFSSSSLAQHISELNKEMKHGEIITKPPRIIKGKYDTDDESEWTETQKPDILELNEIEHFRIMINPILLGLENLLLIVDSSSKRSKAELINLLSGTPNVEGSVILLPSLLKTPKLIDVINSWLVEEDFIESHDPNDVCPYKWIGKKDNEEMELYSKVSVSDSDKYFDKKTLKYSYRYQVAAFGRWLFDAKLMTMTKYNASLVARSILAYYHIENTESNEKAFRVEKGYKPYMDYYRSLKKVVGI